MNERMFRQKRAALVEVLLLLLLQILQGTSFCCTRDIYKIYCNMEDTKKTLDVWQETFWAAGKIPWHRQVPNDFLVRHINQLLDGRTSAELTVFIPLCGKSVDLVWLRDKGFKQVIGVEGVRLAIEQFAEDSKITLKETTFGETNIKSHESDDSKLKILEHDFFSLDDPALNGSVDCVWDRASLIAIQPKHRQLYVDTMKRLLKGDKTFRYLLSAYEYDNPNILGPPHSVSGKDVESLFSSFAQIEVLEEKGVVFDGPNKFTAVGTSVKEVIYLLTPK